MASARESYWKEFSDAIRTQLNPDNPAKKIFIQESWTRSREAGVEPCERLLRRAEKFELELTREEDDRLVKAATAQVEQFSKELTLAHVVTITNARGLILLSVGDGVWRATQGLMSGFDWSEDVMGTNGAGTALATDQTVVVFGPEHYLEMFRNSACIGVPLHLPEGKLVGALDFSTRLEDARVEHVIAMVALGSRIQAELALMGDRAA